MSKPIELSQQERMYLHAMTASQGWVVMLKLMDALEDHDDVQNVYANFDIDAKTMEELA